MLSQRFTPYQPDVLDRLLAGASFFAEFLRENYRYNASLYHLSAVECRTPTPGELRTQLESVVNYALDADCSAYDDFHFILCGGLASGISSLRIFSRYPANQRFQPPLNAVARCLNEAIAFKICAQLAHSHELLSHGERGVSAESGWDDRYFETQFALIEPLATTWSQLECARAFKAMCGLPTELSVDTRAQRN